MTPKKKKEDLLKVGAKTKYKEEYNEQVEKLCRLGAKDSEIADFFNVCEATLNNWKNDFPKFLESLKKGKDVFDNDLIENALKNRALGYSHPETKVFMFDGVPVEHEVVKHYPPDTTALIYWTKNRNPSRWRDKQEVEQTNIEAINIPKFKDA